MLKTASQEILGSFDSEAPPTEFLIIHFEFQPLNCNSFFFFPLNCNSYLATKVNCSLPFLSQVKSVPA